jgi:hypothetical protein
MDKYVRTANTHFRNLDEEGCLEQGGFILGKSYKELVIKGINSIDLNGDIVEDKGASFGVPSSFVKKIYI